MKEVEGTAKSVRLDMRTKGVFPGGLTFETEGTLRVLKKEHLWVHTRMAFQSEDGIEGRMETVRTDEGVWTLETDPVFGEVYLHMGPEVMADLEWAGTVLGRGDAVPGNVDGRASSPLGSALLEEMSRQFDLKELRKEVRKGQEGWRVAGDLRADQAPESQPDMPLPDRVEIFVRERDAAVLEVNHFKDGKPVLEIEITRLEINRPMEPESFQLEVGDRKPRDVRDHPPAWAQIERILEEAEAKSEEKRPSKR